LLITFLLVYWALLPLPLLYLSAYFEQHREAYYQHLLEVSADGEWRQWIGFFLKGVAEQADDAILRAKRLQDLQNAWRDKLSQTRTSANLLRLAEHLFEEPVITIPRTAEVLGLTYAPAQRHVQRLVDEGILVAIGDKSYGRTFVCPGILDVLSASTGREL
jgi:Fic family protein